MLCCVVLCCAVLCCAVLCCAVLCCAVLCCAVLCCVVLCCVVLCRAGLHTPWLSYHKLMSASNFEPRSRFRDSGLGLRFSGFQPPKYDQKHPARFVKQHVF